jgi:hypothetical protein
MYIIDPKARKEVKAKGLSELKIEGETPFYFKKF